MMDKRILEGITNQQSGDYYDERTNQFLCIAVENDGPKVIGGYSKSLVDAHPEIRKKVSARIWGHYFGAN